MCVCVCVCVCVCILDINDSFTHFVEKNFKRAYARIICKEWNGFKNGFITAINLTLVISLHTELVGIFIFKWFRYNLLEH